MDQLSVFNEWSPLKNVVIGNASSMYFPQPKSYVYEEGFPFWLRICDRVLCSIFVNKPVPTFIKDKFSSELKGLTKLCLEQGIRINHPIAVKPFVDEPPGISQVFARDPIIVVGEKLIIGQQRVPALRKEIRGYTPLLNNLKKQGEKIVSIADSYKDAFIEGGDVIIDHPYCYVGIGKHASNERGAMWLQEQIGSQWTVVPVPVIMPGMVHLDTCMTLIGPQKGIICRNALIDNLPAPLNDYDFIEVDEKVCRQIGVNVFVLDPNTIVIQSRHKVLKERLEAWGLKVHSLPYSWHATVGGAFRCCTHPLKRGDGNS